MYSVSTQKEYNKLYANALEKLSTVCGTSVRVHETHRERRDETADRNSSRTKSPRTSR